MSLLRGEEGNYWTIVDVRRDENSDAGITPYRNAASRPVLEANPPRLPVIPTPDATSPTSTNHVSPYRECGATCVSTLLTYGCISAPSVAEGKMTPAERIQNGLGKPLSRIPNIQSLSDVMSAHPMNELVRPAEQENSKAFSAMTVPDQMANSFVCRQHQLPKKTPVLKPGAAKYGSYYLSAGRPKFGEESTALLLLCTKERDQWKVVASAVEVQ